MPELGQMHVTCIACFAAKDIVSMKAQVPEAIFKKAAVSSADAPPMLDMSAVQKAWQMDVSFSCTKGVSLRLPGC